MNNKITLIIVLNLLYLPFAWKIYDYALFKPLTVIGFIVGVCWLSLYFITFILTKYSNNLNHLKPLPILIIGLCWFTIAIWEKYLPTQAIVRIDLLILVPLISLLTPTCFAIWVNSFFKNN